MKLPKLELEFVPSPLVFPLYRRPADLPKYDRFGRRMGYILNNGGFYERCSPVIQPGHEVARTLLS